MNIEEIEWKDVRKNLKMKISEDENTQSIHLSSGYINGKRIIDIYYNFLCDCDEKHCYEIEFKNDSAVEYIWSKELKKLEDIKNTAFVYFRRYLAFFKKKR